MATQLRTYTLQDEETGETFRIEGPDDATPDELGEALDSVIASRTSESPQRPVPAVNNPVAEPATPELPSALPSRSIGEGVETRNNLSQRNRPDVEGVLRNMWDQGFRDPEEYNSLLRDMFPDIPDDQLITPEKLARVQAREDYFRMNPQEARGSDFIVNDWTGIAEAQAPETMTEEIGSGLSRGLANLANTATGVAALGADVVGADETAEDLLDSYLQTSAAIQLNNPASVDGVRDIESFGDAGRYAVGVISEFIPEITSSAGAGIIGAEVGRIAARRAATQFIESRMAQGLTQEAAERELARQAQTWAARSAAAATTGASIAQESGDTYAQTYGQTDERAPWLSIAAGSVSGALDAILPNRIAAQLSPTLRGRLTTRVAREGVEGFAIEGATEAAQQFISQLPTSVITGESPFTEEMYLQMEEAFVRGGLPGGAISSATSMMAGNENVRSNEPSLNGEFGYAETIYRPTATPRARRSYPQQIQRMADEMQARVETFTERWERRPSITVLNNFSNEQGVDDNALGVYRNGAVLLNAEALLKEADARGVTLDDMVAAITFHESLGHHALAREYGDGLNAMLESFYDNGTQAFRDLVDTWVENNPGAYDNDPNPLAAQVEEVIAEYAENDGQIPVTILDQVKNYIKDFARRAKFNLRVSEREVKTILGIAQRNMVEGRTEAQDSASDSTRYMYVGRRANTANDYTLRNAQLEAARGRDVGPASETRQQTGWFRGPDGGWRFEIDDSNASLGNFDTGTLEGALNHPELFEAYPRLRDIPVEFVNSSRYDGMWDEASKTITLNRSLSYGDMLSTLIHEVQHVVQSTENFARGGNSETALLRAPDDVIMRGAQRWADDLDRFSRDAIEEYDILVELSDTATLNELRSAVRAEAEAYRKRGNATLEELDAASQRVTEAYTQFYREMGLDYFQDIIKNKKNHRAAGLIDRYLVKSKSVDEGLNAASRIYDDMAASSRRIKDRIDANDVQGLRSYFNDKDSARFDSYQHLFGEVEARDTQNRLEMSAGERQMNTPYTSEKFVDPENYILQGQEFGPALSSSRGVSELLKKDRRARRRTAEDNTRNEIEAARRNGIDPESVGLPNRYMKPKSDRVRLTRKFGERRPDGTIGFSREGNVIGPESQAAKTFLKELGVFNNYELMRMGTEDAINRAERLGIDHEWLDYYNDAYLRSSYGNDAAPPTPQPDMSRYMPDTSNRYARSKPKKKKERETLRPEEVTAEELIEARSATDILDLMINSKQDVILTTDELIQELILRGVPPSAVTDLASINPGELTKKMLKYDIAAQKLNDRLAKLYAKMQNGSATQKDRTEFVKTTLALEDVASNLFAFQSEAGRMLAAIKKMEITYKKVTSLREALKALGTDAEGMYALDDPATFLRYANAVMNTTNANNKGKSKVADTVVNVLNTPRAIMSSMDLSAPLRQGIYFISSKEYWQALPSMFKAWLPKSGEEFYQNVMNAIKLDKNFPLMMRAGLSFSTVDGPLVLREESFQSELAQRIPGVRMSERAYNAFLNKLRADLFNRYMENMERAGMDLSDPKHISPDDLAYLKAVGAWINAGTGRGNLPKGMAGAAPMLNALLFSPRLISSRVNLIANPTLYTRLPPGMRQEAIKRSVAFGAIAVLTLSLLSYAIPEAEVEWDSRSSDFGKLRVGDTRYDMLGGFSQYYTLGARLAAYTSDEAFGFDVGGHRKTLSGEFVDYSTEYGAMSAMDAVINFFRNKFSPNASFVADFLAGENSVGEEFTFSDAVVSRSLPLFIQDYYELVDQNGFGTGTAMAAPVLFGVGAQTYTPAALDLDQRLTIERQFDSKEYSDMSNDLVTVSQGKASLSVEGHQMWENVLNSIFADMVEEEISTEEWPNLSDEEKRELLNDIKVRARRETKQYMLYELGME